MRHTAIKVMSEHEWQMSAAVSTLQLRTLETADAIKMSEAPDSRNRNHIIELSGGGMTTQHSGRPLLLSQCL